MSRRLLIAPALAAAALVACTCLLAPPASADGAPAPSSSATAQAAVVGPSPDLGQSALYAPVVTGPTGRSVK